MSHLPRDCAYQAFGQRGQAGIAHATWAQTRTWVERLGDRVLVAKGDVERRAAIPTHLRRETTRFGHGRQDYFHDIVQIFHLADDDVSAVRLLVSSSRAYLKPGGVVFTMLYTHIIRRGWIA
jgi:hypothetical protein